MLPTLPLHSFWSYMQQFDVDSVDPKTKSTALMIAAREGSLKSLRVLLNRGASIDLQDADGRTGLMLACLDGKH